MGVSTPLPLVAGQIITGRGQLAGFSFAETAGAAATVSLYDGTSAAGVPLLIIRMPAQVGGFSVGDSFGRPLQCSTGLFAVVTGTVVGAVYC